MDELLTERYADQLDAVVSLLYGLYEIFEKTTAIYGGSISRDRHIWFLNKIGESPVSH